MDSGSIFQIIILIILLLLSAFFSSAETALTTVNRIRMRSLAEDGNSRAACVLKVTDDSGKMLSAILIGNNIVNLSASSIATSLALDLWGSVGAGIATGILTLLILIFGEISPKTIAAINAEKISLSYFNQFIISAVDICKCHINSRYHDFFCLGITEIEYVIDHLMFL